MVIATRRQSSVSVDQIEQVPTASSRSTTDMRKPPGQEIDTLSRFYSALGGENWAVSYGWKDVFVDRSSNPCGTPGWFGVSCAVILNVSHVTEIKLSHNNLRGFLPSLRNLTHLSSIDFSNNQFGIERGRNVINGEFR